jgi:hypothetical protein
MTITPLFLLFVAMPSYGNPIIKKTMEEIPEKNYIIACRTHKQIWIDQTRNFLNTLLSYVRSSF